MKIVNITESPKLTKRYRIYLDDGKHYDFGLDGGSTFLEHGNEEKRLNYWKRHYGSQKEHSLISELIPSPATFSAFLLWGKSKSLEKNIIELNKLFSKKYKNG